MKTIEEIYKNYSNLIKNYVFVITGNMELAEEIMQETFVIAIDQINTVLITIFAIFDIFCISCKFLLNHKFYMDVKDVNLCYTGEGEFRGNKTLVYMMNSNSKFLVPLCFEEDTVKDTENGIVYMKLVGHFDSHFKGDSTTSFWIPEIDDGTKCVYLIDSKDNKIKIWDKEQGALTDILPTIK